MLFYFYVYVFCGWIVEIFVFGNVFEFFGKLIREKRVNLKSCYSFFLINLFFVFGRGCRNMKIM